MLTPEDLSAIPLFASLEPQELAHLTEQAADLHLAVGEFAVHEGEPRALFVVLAGKIEVVKLIDGVPRSIAQRRPGDLFGEIPLVFGVPFQAGFQAKKPSRVMRLDARDYHALAGASSEIAGIMGALAHERLGGLQGLAAKPPNSRATVVGHQWDAACAELRRFLTRNQITFDWLTPDSTELPPKWPGALPADDDCPAVCCEDGTILLRPRTREIAERLGLQTCARAGEYDTVIIGGGPAGLAAAVYGASEGLRTLVIEREAPGGQAGTSSRIENYLGFPTGVSGDELARRALQQANRLGAEIMVTREVTGIDAATRTVLLDEGESLRTRTIVIATGVAWRRLDVQGFDKLLGKGVWYGASRSDAHMTQGLDIHLIGAGNSAGQAAMFFANHAGTVTLVVRGDSLEKSMSHYLIEQIRSKSNIRIALQTELSAVHGDDHLKAVELIDLESGSVNRTASDGVFVFIGADAETAWLPDDIARDARDYVLTGDEVVRAGHWHGDRDPYLLETSVPGVFACGDVRSSPVKRVASAVGEGSMAIAFIHKYLQQTAGGQPS